MDINILSGLDKEDLTDEFIIENAEDEDWSEALKETLITNEEHTISFFEIGSMKKIQENINAFLDKVKDVDEEEIYSFDISTRNNFMSVQYSLKQDRINYLRDKWTTHINKHALF